MLRTVLAAAIALAAMPSLAFAYCSEPDAPYCATQYGDFSDEYEFDRCKDEMEYYESEVSDFVECLRREVATLLQEYEAAASKAARESDDAIEEYNDAAESFNNRAS